MLAAVPDQDVVQLQQEHSALIAEYEEIIKQKIDAFDEMINNLKTISQGNVQYIKNEEAIADRRLMIEVWDRDIYQKKRVNMDVQVEIQNLLTYIELEDFELAKRIQTIQDRTEELSQANQELEELKLEFEERQKTLAEI